MKTLRNALVSIVGASVVAGAFVVAPAFANHPASNPFLGTPVHEGIVERTIKVDRDIVIDTSTKWVNVTGGETIRFVVDGKSFVWLFDVYDRSLKSELNKIAPAGILNRKIDVFVSPDPRYTSS